MLIIENSENIKKSFRKNPLVILLMEENSYCLLSESIASSRVYKHRLLHTPPSSSSRHLVSPLLLSVNHLCSRHFHNITCEIDNITPT